MPLPGFMPGPVPDAAPMGMPPMGPSPMGRPGFPPRPPAPPPALQALQRLSGMPPAAREQRAMQEAAVRLQIAMAGVSLRSAKAAEHLSKAYQEVQRAIQLVQELGSAPVGPPPNFLGGVPTPMGQGQPAPLL